MSNHPQVGDRARYISETINEVGRITRVAHGTGGTGRATVKWADHSSTDVRLTGFVAATDADTEWNIVR